jgi:hypothetical protein
MFDVYLMFNIIEHCKYSEHIPFDKIFTQILRFEMQITHMDKYWQAYRPTLPVSFSVSPFIIITSFIGSALIALSSGRDRFYGAMLFFWLAIHFRLTLWLRQGRLLSHLSLSLRGRVGCSYVQLSSRRIERCFHGSSQMVNCR